MSWSCGEKKQFLTAGVFQGSLFFIFPLGWVFDETTEEVCRLWKNPGAKNKLLELSRLKFSRLKPEFFFEKCKRVFGIADSRHEILPTGALDQPYALCTDDRDSRRSPWKIHVHKQFEFLESDTVLSIYTRDSVFWHYYIGDGFNTVIYTSRRVESSSIFGWKFSKDCWSQLAYGTLYTICGISLI